MKLSTILNTSVGQKIIMASTGLFLVSFLLVHCYVNANVLLNNPEENFNKAAHFMGTNLLIRIGEVVLFLLLLLHIYKGLYLYFFNKGKRKVGYKVSPPGYTSRWYSRSMTFLGTLILLFLVVHLADFWVPSRFGGLNEVKYSNFETHNLYLKMKEVFKNPIVVIIYVLGCISLAWHLVHGFQSAFKTFGITHKTTVQIINVVGIIFSIIVPAIFALMPIFMYYGIHFDLKDITVLF